MVVAYICDYNFVVHQSLSHVLLFVTWLLRVSLPDSAVHGISQARILEGGAISFSRRSSWHKDQTHVSCTGRWVLHIREAQLVIREMQIKIIMRHHYTSTRWLKLTRGTIPSLDENTEQLDLSHTLLVGMQSGKKFGSFLLLKQSLLHNIAIPFPGFT